MARLLSLTDQKQRDGQVSAENPAKKPPPRYLSPDGREVHSERLIKATEGFTYDALLKKFPDSEAFARALVEGDPEIDLERVGRKLGDADRVWVRQDGTVLYAARILQVVYNPDGTEKSRQDFSDVEATVSEEGPAIPWTGRLFDPREVVGKFVLSKKLRLRHVNGLTFDFLYDMAKSLHDAGKLLLVGTGPKGAAPLIFQTNGAPYRGFIEGRVKDGGYLLVLHLSNLELKAVTP
jgi:hypothetical protein